MQVIDKLLLWLAPARRKALYAAATGATALATVLGVITPETATQGVSFGVAVLELTALVLAAIKTKRADMRALYLAGAAVVVGAKGLGIISDGDASHWLEVLAHALPLIPLVVAVMRTTPATPTGEPVREFTARTDAIVDDAVVHAGPLDVPDLVALEGTLAAYPNADGSPVDLTPEGHDWLLERQREAGIYADGVLGPQSWLVVTGSAPRGSGTADDPLRQH